MQEMTEDLCLDLFTKKLSAKMFSWWVSYDYKSLEHCPYYDGPLSEDFYGRLHPKHNNGTVRFYTATNNTASVVESVLAQFDKKTDHRLLFRRLGICAGKTSRDGDAFQLDLFTDYEALERERRMQAAMLEVRKRYGAGAIFKGLNMEEGATSLERHKQIGGHRA